MVSESDRMNVRVATEADVDELTQIWHDGWHDAHARIVPAELVARRTLKSFRDRLCADLSAVRVLQTRGPMVGLSMMRGDELYQFYVAESFRGSGAAAILMADAEARLAERGVEIAWLACAIGNDRAARFYEKCRWMRTGTIFTDSDTASGLFSLKVWRYEKSLNVPQDSACPTE
jgi:GNAT superfamily N-acetyltransferase